MATRAKAPAASEPEVVGQIVLLPVADIEIGERLRPVDPVAAEGIGRTMQLMGQKKPIEVCRLPGRKQWTVVDGAHRVTGAQVVGITHLRAEVVENDVDERLEREITAEVFDPQLAPLDRAMFVGRLAELNKKRAGITTEETPQAIAAKARWEKVKADAADASLTVRDAYGFNDRIAERLGFSIATIERDLFLYRHISSSAVGRLRAVAHPALQSAGQLRKLAKLDEDAQKAAVDRLLWEEEGSEARKPLTLDEAIAAGKAKVAAQPDAETKAFSQFFSAFGRMSAGQKKTALAKLADMLPAGYRLTFGEQLTNTGFPEGYEDEREKALVAIEGARDVIFGILEDALGGEDVRIDEDRAAALGQAEHDLAALNLAITADRVPLDMGGAAPDEVPAPVEEEPVPACSIRASVKPDYLVCLECGEQHQMLKRHLSSQHGLAPAAYLQRWKLPLDYPMIAPNYAEKRRALAAKIGLGSGAKAGGRA